MTEEQEAILRLSSIPGIGSSRLRSLISRFKSASGIFGTTLNELMAAGIDRTTAEYIRNSDGGDFAEIQLKKMKKCEAKLITYWDKEYPEQLKQIYDPPAFLFVRGKLKAEDKYSIAVVGTRQPSEYGKIVTEKLASELARKGITIVSGMAYGIDTLAHHYALKSGSRTIAVLGSGVDVIYPEANKKLSRSIIAQGAIVSEFPMGTAPDWMNFPRRNRIICGMSLGTVVIEAGKKSGALITATLALEQNREVFAVPGNIDNPKSIGTNELIKQGAKLVASADDVLEELKPQLRQFIEREKNNVQALNLTDEEVKFLNYLSHEPKHIDKIALEAGRSTAEVLSILLSLELKDIIKQLAGKMFVRV